MEHDKLKEERNNWFQDTTIFRPNTIDFETNKSNKGRKPSPSKRIVNKSPEYNKWWRLN